MLLTVLASLPFVGALAASVHVLRAELGENWGKVGAALRGESPLAMAMMTRPVTVRFSPRPAQARMAFRAEPRWRVAA